MPSLFSDEELLKRINAIILKSIKGIPLTPEEKTLYEEHLGKKIRKVRDERREESPSPGEDNNPPEEESPKKTSGPDVKHDKSKGRKQKR